MPDVSEGVPQMTMDLIKRIDALEAVQEIKQLKALGMYHADRQDAESFAGLFSEDGVFVGVYQEHRGREAIAKGLQFLPFAIHYAMNPIISVSGDSAYGRWYTLRPQIDHSGNASWAAGWYDDEYVRVAGTWKFKSVKIRHSLHSAYEKGWAKDDVVPPAPIEGRLAAELFSKPA
jgi:SnoaL-like domain